MTRNILTPGYLRWDGAKFTTDPDVQVIVPNIVGDWISYTPGFNSTGLDASLGNGVVSGQWRTVKDSIRITILINMGSSTVLGSGNFILNLPLPSSQMQIDNSKCLLAPLLDGRYHLLAQTGLLGSKVSGGGTMVATTDTTVLDSVTYDFLHIPLNDFYGGLGQTPVNPDVIMISAEIPVLV